MNRNKSNLFEYHAVGNKLRSKRLRVKLAKILPVSDCHGGCRSGGLSHCDAWRHDAHRTVCQLIRG